MVATSLCPSAGASTVVELAAQEPRLQDGSRAAEVVLELSFEDYVMSFWPSVSPLSSS